MVNEKQPLSLEQLGQRREGLQKRIKQRTLLYSAVGVGNIKPTNIENAVRIGTIKSKIDSAVKSATQNLGEVLAQIENHEVTLIDSAQEHLSLVTEKRKQLDLVHTLAKQGHLSPETVTLAEKEFETFTQKPQQDERLQKGLEILRKREAKKEPPAAQLPKKHETKDQSKPQVAFDPDNRKIIVDGKEIELSDLESAFIEYIYDNRNVEEAISKQKATDYVRHSLKRKSVPGLIAAGIERKIGRDLFERQGGVKNRTRWFIENLSLAQKPKEAEKRRQEEIVLDGAKKSVTLDGKTIKLSRLNYAVVTYLLSHLNEEIATKDVNEVIQENGHSSEIDQVAYELRKQFGKDFLLHRTPTRGRFIWNVGEKYKDYIIKERNKQQGRAIYDRTNGTLKSGENEIQLNAHEFLVIDYILKHKKGKITKDALGKYLSETESNFIDPDTIIRNVERRLGREIFLRGGRGPKIIYSSLSLDDGEQDKIADRKAKQKTLALPMHAQMVDVINAILDNPASLTISDIIKKLGPSSKTQKLLTSAQAVFAIKRAIAFISIRINNCTASEGDKKLWDKFKEYNTKTGKKAVDAVNDVFAKRPIQEIKKDNELILNEEETSILMSLVGTLRNGMTLSFGGKEPVVFKMSEWIRKEYEANKKSVSKFDPQVIANRRGDVKQKILKIIDSEDAISQHVEFETVQYLLMWIRSGDEKQNAPGDIQITNGNSKITFTPHGFVNFLFSDPKNWRKIIDGTRLAAEGHRVVYDVPSEDTEIVELQKPAVIAATAPKKTIAFQAERPIAPGDRETAKPNADQKRKSNRKQTLENKARENIKKILSRMDIRDRDEAFSSSQMQNKFGITRKLIAKMLQSGNIDALIAKGGVLRFDFPTAVLLKFLGNKKLISLDGKVDLKKLIAEEISRISP